MFELILTNNYEVDFRQDNSINSLLGFKNKLNTSGPNETENNVNILTISSILVNIYIISGSYVNGSRQPSIYSFFPNVSPGYRIIETPHNLLCISITSDTIYSVTTWLTDQNEDELNLRIEHLSMRFHMRKI